MSDISPEQMMKEFKIFLKRKRLEEIQKTVEEKELMILQQIRMLVDSDKKDNP